MMMDMILANNQKHQDAVDCIEGMFKQLMKQEVVTTSKGHEVTAKEEKNYLQGRNMKVDAPLIRPNLVVLFCLLLLLLYNVFIA